MCMTRDSASRMVFLGFIVPGLIMVLVIHNLFVGRVYLLWNRSGGSSGVVDYQDLIWGVLSWNDDSWVIAAAVLLKSGIAVFLHAVYGLANLDRFAGAWQYFLLIGYFLAGAGSVIFVGLFLDLLGLLDFLL